MAKKFLTSINLNGTITASSDISAGGVLKSTQALTNEGGEIQLSAPSSGSTLSGPIIIDIYQNKLRFFENGGTARGYYIDLTTGGAGAGTDLVGSGSASNSFATISTPSGTSPVADSSTDTLTLSAGTGITITGDSSTDTVTIGTTGLISGVGTTKVSYQTTAPSSPITGDIWIDSDGSTAEVNSIQPALPMVSTHYYTAPASNSSVTASLNLAYYLPLVVVETTKFDRIAIRTASSFSGSGVVRLGIYNDSGGQPSTLVLDAGTVATSASNTAYEITISQTLSAGIYWLAFVSQTNATTNNYRATITAYYQTTHGTNTSGSGQAVGWTQGSVSGAFATASVSGANFNMPTVWLRKE